MNKYIIIFLMFLSFYNLKAQSIGWEGRTNGKEYFKFNLKGFELRHRILGNEYLFIISLKKKYQV